MKKILGSLLLVSLVVLNVNIYAQESQNTVPATSPQNLPKASVTQPVQAPPQPKLVLVNHGDKTLTVSYKILTLRGMPLAPELNRIISTSVGRGKQVTQGPLPQFQAAAMHKAGPIRTMLRVTDIYYGSNQIDCRNFNHDYGLMGIAINITIDNYGNCYARVLTAVNPS